MICCEHHGRRGRGYIYSDVATETAQVVKGVFDLSLRVLEDFTNSAFQLMGIPLDVLANEPSYITQDGC
ncbi:transposase [Shewanella sp.]|uniref:transposase n=1 Tax=Shewanella sp. TaxID=50422 RepID=UPI00260090DE|nr:transposase [Shewanella sp.]